jgi:hypothetical protein
MRDLLQVAKDMEEIREEVRVSGRLYDDIDRRLIIEGIALIIIYLQQGIAQYVAWCTRAGGRTPEARPHHEAAWVVKLVADHDSGRPAGQPGDEDWAPEGHMPSRLRRGIGAEQAHNARLRLRGITQGSGRATGEGRTEWNIAARRATEEARKPPLTRT